MLFLIKSNLRRVLRNPAVWITFATCFVLFGGFILITREVKELNSLGGTENIGVGLTGILAMVILIITHVILRGDIEGNMFVPRATAGNSRTTVYFSEFITVTVVALIFWVVVQGFFLGLQAILEPNDREQLIHIVLYDLLGLLSVLGMCAFVTALDMNVKNRFVSLVILIGIILVMFFGIAVLSSISEPMLRTVGSTVTRFCPPLCFKKYAYSYDYIEVTDVFYSPSPSGNYDLWEHAVYAVLTIAIATSVGFLRFRKKDLK